MRKSLVATIAAAALIASAGLATGQQTDQQPNMPGNTNQPSQDLYQNQTPGAENPSVGQPATSAKQGRSAAVKKHAAMKKHQVKPTPFRMEPSPPPRRRSASSSSVKEIEL
jgi:hypothetical protein